MVSIHAVMRKTGGAANLPRPRFVVVVVVAESELENHES